VVDGDYEHVTVFTNSNGQYFHMRSTQFRQHDEGTCNSLTFHYINLYLINKQKSRMLMYIRGNEKEK
jgi:hypothetical protein